MTKIIETTTIPTDEYEVFKDIIEGLNFRKDIEYECPVCLAICDDFCQEHKEDCALCKINSYLAGEVK